MRLVLLLVRVCRPDWKTGWFCRHCREGRESGRFVEIGDTRGGRSCRTSSQITLEMQLNEVLLNIKVVNWFVGERFALQTNLVILIRLKIVNLFIILFCNWMSQMQIATRITFKCCEIDFICYCLKPLHLTLKPQDVMHVLHLMRLPPLIQQQLEPSFKYFA